MDVRQLQYFIALADELNFTRAAARCKIAQSALSHQIARLEQEHRVALFERTSRRVSLTPAGELLLPRARRIVAGLDDAKNELAQLAGLVTGQLRIGRAGGDNETTAQLERALARFHQQHPEVQITIDDTNSQHLPDNVRDGTIDCAMVDLSAGQVGIDLMYHSLAAEPLVAISDTPSTATSSPDGSISLAELATRGRLVEMDPGSGLRRQIDEAFDRAGVTRRIALEVSEPAAVIRFVGMGFGSAVVPLSATIGAGNIHVQPIAEQVVRYPTGLINRQLATCTPATRAFLGMLKEQNLIDRTFTNGDPT